jgi:hypothetical protein
MRRGSGLGKMMCGVPLSIRAVVILGSIEECAATEP